MERVAQHVAAHLIDSLRLAPRPTNDESIPVGASKFGGRPDLPAGCAWPVWGETPLSFIAQVNLADVAKLGGGGDLPSAGLLSFFYGDGDNGPWGFDPADRGAAQVLFTSGDLRGLTRTAHPSATAEDARCYPACSMAVRIETTWPRSDDIALTPLGLSIDDRCRYSDILSDVLDDAGGGPMHRLLGYADNIQGDMHFECQLVTNGLYCGDRTGYQDPRAARLAAHAADWVLLLQVDSDDDTGMMWGDCGRLYFWIRREELVRGEFENVWFILQCY